MTDPGEVVDNVKAQRFELNVDGQVAVLEYDRTAESLALVHTEVPPELRGHHIGERLVVAALDSARAAGLRIVAVCPFVREYLRRHPPDSAPSSNVQ